MPTLQELRDQRAAAWSQAQEYNERSTGTEINMTAEEEAAWARALDDVDSLGEQIANRERTENLDKRFAEIDERTTPVAPDGSPDIRDGYRSAFEKYVRHGLTDLDAEERQMLQANFRAQGTDTGAGGGYTVPEGFWAKVTETMAFYGGMQANIELLRTDAGNDIPWPTNNDTGNEGVELDENTQVTEQDVVFGQKTLGSYTYTSKLIRVSLQLLQDSGINVEDLLSRKIGERLGRVINRRWTTGTGASQPQGFVTGATTGKTTASGTVITYNELIDLIHSVDVAYRNDRCRFMMHDQIVGYVRKIRDDSGGAGVGRPLWEPSAQAGEPDRLLGYATTVNNHMASGSGGAPASGEDSIGFGDFQAHYVGRLVNGGQMLRLSERYADYLQVGFLGFQRADGLVQDTAAVKLLTQA